MRMPNSFFSASMYGQSLSRGCASPPVRCSVSPAIRSFGNRCWIVTAVAFKLCTTTTTRFVPCGLWSRRSSRPRTCCWSRSVIWPMTCSSIDRPNSKASSLTNDSCRNDSSSSRSTATRSPPAPASSARKRCISSTRRWSFAGMSFGAVSRMTARSAVAESVSAQLARVSCSGYERDSCAFTTRVLSQLSISFATLPFSRQSDNHLVSHVFPRWPSP
mmetsp:Transcript_18745/g.58146  ORF Transcript_18745/g.58146 Transcript_18745/m.58146 type:complete len:217 (+) Transcript_18745:1289-1939(+)